MIRGESLVRSRPECIPLSLRTESLYLAVGESKTIRVGDNLQEDVHVIKNGGKSGVLAIVLGDLVGEVREGGGSVLIRHLPC